MTGQVRATVYTAVGAVRRRQVRLEGLHGGSRGRGAAAALACLARAARARRPHQPGTPSVTCRARSRTAPRARTLIPPPSSGTVANA